MITRHPETALVPYLRGELSGEEQTSVARHLEGCASCREAAEGAASAMRELARRVEDLSAPDLAIYRAELYRKLDARGELAARGNAEPRSWRPRIVGLSLGALGAAAAALILIFVMRQGARVAPPPIDQLATQEGTMQEAAMTGADVGLLRDYPMVEHLDLLENYDVIAHLDEVSPSAPANDENRS
ncbi:MAG: zf-HC2 domain-containing protein [Candidatus Binataceae bacterium]|jgi:anti-sigma factor RsiW